MPKSLEEIVTIAAHRITDSQPLVGQMREMRDRYNGDVVYAFQEQMTGGSPMPPLTPHLIGQSIDQMALRAASVQPALYVPAVNPSKDTGKGSRHYASIRRRAYAATLTESKWPLIARRMFRHLTGYAVSSLQVVPDFQAGLPKIRLRNPLQTFPDPRAAEDLDEPENCVYVYGMSAAVIRKIYPQLRSEVGGPVQASVFNETLHDVIEWVDSEQIVTAYVGKRTYWEENATLYGSIPDALELSRIPNRADMFPGVAMGRVTLDRIASSLQHTVGLIDWQAKLTLLDVIATERSIFPDLYILGETGREPRIVGGKWQDGRTGNANMLLDAQSVGQLRSDPSPNGKMAIDRLERNVRTDASLVPQMAGETYGALRTGQAIDALGGFAVDPVIAELHEIEQAWRPMLLKAINRCYTGYWGSKSFSLFSGYPGDRGEVSFIPSKHLAESERAMASYPIAGADAQGTNIVLGQMLSMEGISLETFRELHPWIQDASAEQKKVLLEKMERWSEQAIMQGIASDRLPLMYLTRIKRKLEQSDDPDITDAIDAADKEIREEQAQEQEAAPPGGALPAQQPGMDGVPEPAGQTPVSSGPIQTPGGLDELRSLTNAMAATSQVI